MQRYARAAHLVTEDVPEAAEHVWRWVLAGDDRRGSAAAEAGRAGSASSPWAAQQARAGDSARRPWRAADGRGAPAVLRRARGPDRRPRPPGLQGAGVRPGHRVALLVPPGLDLTVAVYACWRAGAVIVVADAGLGLRGLVAALRSAGPDHVIGIRRRTAGRGPARPADPAAPIPVWRAAPSRPSRTAADRSPPDPDAEAAVLFTSGATGPAKGVVYTQAQLAAQIDLVRSTLRADRGGPLVAAFAPFALYGPALGVGAVVPDMTVTAPGTLTAAALADAVGADRRDRGLRLAGGAAQRGGHGRVAVRRPAGGAGPGPAGDVGRRARSRPPLLRQVAEVLPAPSCTRRTG